MACLPKEGKEYLPSEVSFASAQKDKDKGGKPLPGREEDTPPPGKEAKGSRKRRFTFLELFAGFAGLSLAIAECMRYANVLTHDIKTGMDLLDEDDFMETHRMCEFHNVDWVHMAPVCRTMSRARRNDRHGKVKTLRTDDRPEGFG